MVFSYNHNHRPCRWYALAPLGPFTSRAYRLIEFSFACMKYPTAIEIAVGFLFFSMYKPGKQCLYLHIPKQKMFQSLPPIRGGILWSISLCRIHRNGRNSCVNFYEEIACEDWHALSNHRLQPPAHPPLNTPDRSQPISPI